MASAADRQRRSDEARRQVRRRQDRQRDATPARSNTTSSIGITPKKSSHDGLVAPRAGRGARGVRRRARGPAGDPPPSARAAPDDAARARTAARCVSRCPAGAGRRTRWCSRAPGWSGSNGRSRRCLKRRRRGRAAWCIIAASGWRSTGTRRIRAAARLAGASVRIGGPAENLPRRFSAGSRARRSGCSRTILRSIARAPGMSRRRSGCRGRIGAGAAAPDRRTIRINWRLVQAPDFVRRSVVAHEVAHMTHFDHSPAFHALLAGLFEGEVARGRCVAARRTGARCTARFG